MNTDKNWVYLAMEIHLKNQMELLDRLSRKAGIPHDVLSQNRQSFYELRDALRTLRAREK